MCLKQAPRSRLTLGTFVAFMAYQMRLLPPIQALMGLYAGLATASVSLRRVREIMDASPEVVEGGVTVTSPRFGETWSSRG